MGVLIDASVLIDYERGDLDPRSIGSTRPDDELLFISTITVSELLHGVHRAETAVRRVRRSVFVEGVIDRFPLLNIDLPTARAHTELWAELAMSGRLIGPHDLWLAAACLAHGLSLATTTTREFGRVPALEIDDWSEA